MHPEYTHFYQGTGLLGFAVFALLFFIAFFSVVVVMTWRHVPRDDPRSQLPLSDGETPFTGERLS